MQSGNSNHLEDGIKVTDDATTQIQGESKTLKSTRDGEEHVTRRYRRIHSYEPKSRLNLGFWDTLMMQMTFQTSGAVIGMPFAFATMGYIFALLVLIFYIILCMIVVKLIADVQLRTTDAHGKEYTEPCTTLGDVGDRMGGRLGRYILRSFQLANLYALLMVMLNLMATSLQYVSNFPWNCLGYWTLLMFAFMVLVLQVVKVWKHNATLAYGGTLLVCVKTLVLLPWAYGIYGGDIKDSPSYVGSAKPFLAPSGYNDWYDFSMGLSSIIWGIAPIFIQTELTWEMKNPLQTRNATWGALIGFGSLYCIAGLTGSLMLGYPVTSPVTLMFPRGGLAIAINIFVFLASIIDYIAGALVVNDFQRSLLFSTSAWCRETIPAREQASKMSKYFIHFLLTLPSSILALIVTICIPDFEVLTSIVVAFTVSGSQTCLPTLCWYYGLKLYKIGKEQMKDWVGNPFLHFISVFGLILTGYLVAGSIYSFVDTYILGGSTSSFFCDAD